MTPVSMLLIIQLYEKNPSRKKKGKKNKTQMPKKKKKKIVVTLDIAVVVPKQYKKRIGN